MAARRARLHRAVGRGGEEHRADQLPQRVLQPAPPAGRQHGRAARARCGARVRQAGRCAPPAAAPGRGCGADRRRRTPPQSAPSRAASAARWARPRRSWRGRGARAAPTSRAAARKSPPPPSRPPGSRPPPAAAHACARASPARAVPACRTAPRARGGPAAPAGARAARSARVKGWGPARGRHPQHAARQQLLQARALLARGDEQVAVGDQHQRARLHAPQLALHRPARARAPRLGALARRLRR